MKKKNATNEKLKLWEKRARQVYKDSLKIFKDGFHGLEVITGKTVEVGKIKIANQQAVNRIRTLFADLGQRVYESVAKQRKDVLRITPDIAGFVAQIKKVQNFVESNVSKLKHLTTVNEVSRRSSRPSKVKAKSKTNARSTKKSPARRKPAAKRRKSARR